MYCTDKSEEGKICYLLLVLKRLNKYELHYMRLSNSSPYLTEYYGGD
jgi:hypothetical protein